jgi:hypothetical protein
LQRLQRRCLHYKHYRIRALCRAPRAHGRGQNPHGTTFVVRILPGRTAKGARHIFARQRPLPCAVGKGNTRHMSLSCATCDAQQRKGVNGRPQRDGVTRSLSCATHKCSRHRKMKKRKKSKAGWGSPLPGHYHVVVGRSVPHASDATTITPSWLLPASIAARARRLCSTPNPPPRRARPPLLPPLDPARSRSERKWTPHDEGGRTAGHTPVGKEADGARSRRLHENSTAFSTSCSVPPCSCRLWGPEEASTRRP